MKYFDLFLNSLKLGLTSFGGPIAHLSYFHYEFVNKKKWISDSDYADLVALCQFLPGPASSQVLMTIGLLRAGILGAVASWIGFTLPSALILIMFGLGMTHIDLSLHQYWIHGLKVSAVAVVAQAVLAMGKKLCPDRPRVMIAILTSVLILFINSVLMQIITLVGAGILGIIFLNKTNELPHNLLWRRSKINGSIFLLIFFGLIIFLPILRSHYPLESLQLFDSFYRAGSLVFGGGHVVLPLLQAEVVPNGWVTNDLFMAGYGVANAMPGPLFSFSSYLGAVSSTSPRGWFGAFICLVAIFLPSFLLVVGIFPFWEKLRSVNRIRQAMLGINAAVVGMLFAALYNPVWISGIYSFKDFFMAIIGLYLLEFRKLSSWIVILIILVMSYLS